MSENIKIDLKKAVEWAGPNNAKHLVLGALEEGACEEVEETFVQMERMGAIKPCWGEAWTAWAHLAKGWFEGGGGWGEVDGQAEKYNHMKSGRGARMVEILKRHMGAMKRTELADYLTLPRGTMGEEMEEYVLGREAGREWEEDVVSNELKKAYRSWLRATSELDMGIVPPSAGLADRMTEKEFEKMSDAVFWQSVDTLDRQLHGEGFWSQDVQEERMMKLMETASAWMCKKHERHANAPDWGNNRKANEWLKSKALERERSALQKSAGLESEEGLGRPFSRGKTL
jgi:hypothetical protein